MQPGPKNRRPARDTRVAGDRLRRDKKGALTTEYVILVGTVGLVVMFALISVGPVLLRNYTATRTLIAAPFP